MAQETCNTVAYWVGSTTERFTISDSLINETSDLSTYNPNTGTNVGGVQLDFVWLENNFGITDKHTFRGAKHHLIDTNTGDAHVLVILPVELTLNNIGETVFGTLSLMTEGLHYASFPLTNAGIDYNVYYFRDLTSFVLPRRQFQFDVEIA